MSKSKPLRLYELERRNPVTDDWEWVVVAAETYKKAQDKANKRRHIRRVSEFK